MTLTVPYLQNPRLGPLVDGTVRAPGEPVRIEDAHPARMHIELLRENRYDAFEFSLAAYLCVRDRPAWSHLGWTALPVFLNKAFFMLELLAHQDSGVRTLADLRGKRVSVPDFYMTAAVWLRILLRELYGIQPSDVTWVNGRSADQRQSTHIGSSPAAGVTVLEKPDGVSIDEMAQRGDVDVALGDRGGTAHVSASRALRRVLEPADARRVLAEFARATGCTPVNHVLVAKRGYLEGRPGRARELFDTFERAKHESYRRAREAAGAYLMYTDVAFAEQAAVYGEDPYPGGVSANLASVQRLAAELLREGQLSRVPAAADLFAPELLGT